MGPRTSRLPRHRERLHMGDQVRGSAALSRVTCPGSSCVRSRRAMVDWRLLGCVVFSVAEAGLWCRRWRCRGGWVFGWREAIFFLRSWGGCPFGQGTPALRGAVPFGRGRRCEHAATSSRSSQRRLAVPQISSSTESLTFWRQE